MECDFLETAGRKRKALKSWGIMEFKVWKAEESPAKKPEKMGPVRQRENRGDRRGLEAQ